MISVWQFTLNEIDKASRPKIEKRIAPVNTNHHALKRKENNKKRILSSEFADGREFTWEDISKMLGVVRSMSKQYIFEMLDDGEIVVAIKSANNKPTTYRVYRDDSLL